MRIALWLITLGCLGQVHATDFSGIKTVLARNHCYECHGKSPLQRRVPLDDYAAMKDLELIAPGNPDESMLFLAVTDEDDRSRMPPRSKGFDRMKDEDIEIIRQWLQAGAPESLEKVSP